MKSLCLNSPLNCVERTTANNKQYRVSLRCHHPDGLVNCKLNFPHEYNNERRDSSCKCTFPHFQCLIGENTDFKKVILFWDEHVIHVYSLILSILMCSVYNPVRQDPGQILGRKCPFYCLPNLFCFTICAHHQHNLVLYTQILISLEIETIRMARTIRYYYKMNNYLII